MICDPHKCQKAIVIKAEDVYQDHYLEGVVGDSMIGCVACSCSETFYNSDEVDDPTKWEECPCPEAFVPVEQ